MAYTSEYPPSLLDARIWLYTESRCSYSTSSVSLRLDEASVTPSFLRWFTTMLKDWALYQPIGVGSEPPIHPTLIPASSLDAWASWASSLGTFGS